MPCQLQHLKLCSSAFPLAFLPHQTQITKRRFHLHCEQSTLLPLRPHLSPPLPRRAWWCARHGTKGTCLVQRSIGSPSPTHLLCDNVAQSCVFSITRLYLLISFSILLSSALFLFYALVTARSGRLIFERSFSSLSSTHLLADNAALFCKSFMSTHRLMISFVALSQLALFLLQTLLPGRSGDLILRIQLVLVTSAVLVRCRLVQSTILRSFIQTRIFWLATPALRTCSYGSTPDVSWLVTGSLASNLHRIQEQDVLVTFSCHLHHSFTSTTSLHVLHCPALTRSWSLADNDNRLLSLQEEGQHQFIFQHSVSLRGQCYEASRHRFDS